jgi:hypothetical protein
MWNSTCRSSHKFTQDTQFFHKRNMCGRNCFASRKCNDSEKKNCTGSIRGRNIFEEKCKLFSLRPVEKLLSRAQIAECSHLRVFVRRLVA